MVCPFHFCLCVYECLSLCVFTYVSVVVGFPLRPKEKVRFPGAGFTGGYETLNMGAGTQTLVL